MLDKSVVLPFSPPQARKFGVLACYLLIFPLILLFFWYQKDRGTLFLYQKLGGLWYPKSSRVLFWYPKSRRPSNLGTFWYPFGYKKNTGLELLVRVNPPLLSSGHRPLPRFMPVLAGILSTMNSELSRSARGSHAYNITDLCCLPIAL